MKLFLDSANLTEIDEALQRGIVSGITTNPSILSREEKGDFLTHIRAILGRVHYYSADNIPVSVEVFTNRLDEMLTQAKRLVADLADPSVVIKIPVGWDELAVIRELSDNGIWVNCTCCMSYNQAILAALAGAKYVSLFWGRIKDTGADAATVVRHVRATFREWNHPAEIIVGSIRHLMDVNEAFQAGADIVTVPFKFLESMTRHPKTDEAVRQFLDDFKRWAASA